MPPKYYTIDKLPPSVSSQYENLSGTIVEPRNRRASTKILENQAQITNPDIFIPSIVDTTPSLDKKNLEKKTKSKPNDEFVEYNLDQKSVFLVLLFKALI
jgi:hypothetical protein